MTSAGYDMYQPAFFVVDDPVFLIDPPAPKTAKISLKRFGVSYSYKEVSLYIPHELINPFERFLILRLPVQVVFPGSVFPQESYQSTSISSCS